MTAQSWFSRFTRGVAEQLAGYGFDRDRSGRAFRYFSPQGDAVVVELQVAKGSTGDEKLFYLNVGLVLGPEWESEKRHRGLADDRLPAGHEGILFRRIGFVTLSGGDQWRIADEQSYDEVSRQVRQRLDETLPDFLRLLDREWIYAQAPELFRARAWRVRAWLLADRGAVEDLERLLEQESARPTAVAQSPAMRAHAERRRAAAQSADDAQ